MHTFADMKREVYESQKAFAGEKKPSMQRRCVGHDYTGRMIYMVTMVVEGRRPLFGTVAGLLLAPWGHHNERLSIRREQCLALNDMSRLICEHDVI